MNNTQIPLPPTTTNIASTDINMQNASAIQTSSPAMLFKNLPTFPLSNATASVNMNTSISNNTSNTIAMNSNSNTNMSNIVSLMQLPVVFSVGTPTTNALIQQPQQQPPKRPILHSFPNALSSHPNLFPPAVKRPRLMNNKPPLMDNNLLFGFNQLPISTTNVRSNTFTPTVTNNNYIQIKAEPNNMFMLQPMNNMNRITSHILKQQTDNTMIANSVGGNSSGSSSSSSSSNNSSSSGMDRTRTLENHKSLLMTAAKYLKLNAKFHIAIKLLDNFRNEHGGKLPSLRAIMKMMKVGFPKAHEILDAYAKHSGIPKEILQQEMTIRQERVKTTANGNGASVYSSSPITDTDYTSKSYNKRNKKKRRRKKKDDEDVYDNNSNRSTSLPKLLLNNMNQKQHRSLNLLDTHETTASNTTLRSLANVNRKIRNHIVRILEYTQMEGKRDACFVECSALEVCIKRFEDFYMKLGVNELLRLAQSYFLLGSMYRERNLRNFAYAYVERALSTFRDCNRFAMQNGYTVQTQSIKKEAAIVCGEDIGHFWPQIVEVYILGGHVLLSNSQYTEARVMYGMALNLAKFIVNAPPITISEALENLAVISMYESRVQDSIRYTKEIIGILEEEVKNGRAEKIKLFNAQAYYSCCLTLGYDEKQKAQGNALYEHVLRACDEEFGQTSENSVGFWCYFGLHWVQSKKYELTDRHIARLANLIRPLKLNEKRVFHDLLSDYGMLLRDTRDIPSKMHQHRQRLPLLFKIQVSNAQAINEHISNQNSSPLSVGLSMGNNQTIQSISGNINGKIAGQISIPKIIISQIEIACKLEHIQIACKLFQKLENGTFGILSLPELNAKKKIIEQYSQILMNGNGLNLMMNTNMMNMNNIQMSSGKPKTSLANIFQNRNIGSQPMMLTPMMSNGTVLNPMNNILLIQPQPQMSNDQQPLSRSSSLILHEQQLFDGNMNNVVMGNGNVCHPSLHLNNNHIVVGVAKSQMNESNIHAILPLPSLNSGVVKVVRHSTSPLVDVQSTVETNVDGGNVVGNEGLNEHNIEHAPFDIENIFGNVTISQSEKHSV